MIETMKRIMRAAVIIAVGAGVLMARPGGLNGRPVLAVEAPVGCPGDVDGDGEVSAGDARLALRAAVGLERRAPDSREFRRADYDGDGIVSLGDARMILRAAVGFAVSAGLPGNLPIRADRDAAIAAVLQEAYHSKDPDGLIHMESYCLLDGETAGGPAAGEETVYLIVYHMTYHVMNGMPEEAEGGFVPAAITFSVGEDGAYALKEYRTPREGDGYESDLRSVFPTAAAEEALHIGRYAEGLKADNRERAAEYLEQLRQYN